MLFFVVTAFSFYSLKGMIRSYSSIQIEEEQNVSKNNLTLNDFIEVGQVLVPSIAVSVSTVLFDVMVELANTIKMNNGGDRPIIDKKSSNYRFAKSFILSSYCYYFGHSYLIPGIIMNEYQSIGEYFSYKDLIGRLGINITITGIATAVITKVIPSIIFFHQHSIGYPLAMCGFAKDRRFSKLSWPLWFYGIGLWCNDHLVEPSVYSVFVQSQRDDANRMKVLAKFLVLFGVVSLTKYLVVYPNFFQKMKEFFNVRHTRSVETYESLSLPISFCSELIAKCIVMQYFTKPMMTHNIYNFIPHIALFLNQDSFDVIFPFLAQVVSFIFFKTIAASLLSEFPLGKKYKVMPIYMKNYAEISRKFAKLLKQFSL